MVNQVQHAHKFAGINLSCTRKLVSTWLSKSAWFTKSESCSLSQQWDMQLGNLRWCCSALQRRYNSVILSVSSRSTMYTCVKDSLTDTPSVCDAVRRLKRIHALEMALLISMKRVSSDLSCKEPLVPYACWCCRCERTIRCRAARYWEKKKLSFFK